MILPVDLCIRHLSLEQRPQQLSTNISWQFLEKPVFSPITLECLLWSAASAKGLKIDYPVRPMLFPT